jgi:hypothetical protein
MDVRLKRFKATLLAELEDILEDIDHVEARYRSEFERLKVSQYVFLENVALLEKEADCVRLLMDELAKIDDSGIKDAEEYAGMVRDLVRTRVSEMEYPQAIERFVDRKIRKALRHAGGHQE